MRQPPDLEPTPPPEPTRTLRLGRDTCGDLDTALRREWLVTNGLGGYAMGSLAGPATRRYHGLLIAALAPPVDRTVLVAGLAEWATIGGQRTALHCHELGDGTFDGEGWIHLEAFELEGTIPTWTFSFGDTRLVRRLWFAHGTDTVYVRYEVTGPGREVGLELRPLVTGRDHHALPRVAEPPALRPWTAPGWPGGVRVTPRGVGRPFRLLADAGRMTGIEARTVRLAHREETARGEDDRSEVTEAATFEAAVRPGRPVTLAFTAEPEASVPDAASVALAAERARGDGLLAAAGLDPTAVDPGLAALVLAADAFIVRRSIPGVGTGGTPPIASVLQPAPGAPAASGGPPTPAASTAAASPTGPPEVGRTIIAGYPWFNDWGRDTMISLPGLTLATGRSADGRAMLRAFGWYVRDGLVPDCFPDSSGRPPQYNTADASLWYPLAIEAYRRATGDEALIDELLPVVRSILDAHVRGTSFGIAMDPADGLVRAGEPGVQLTWMDAMVDGWVVTPRIGKPVEVQALWVNALRVASGWLVSRGDAETAAAFLSLAERAEASFRARFWRPELGHLADVVDGPEGDDPALRPNQVLALSLPHPLVEGPVAVAVLEAVGRSLVTSLGLRSLSPDDPAYHGRFGGDRRSRDAAYHQGTTWSWLIGPYLDAVLRLTGDRARVRAALEPFLDHLCDAGVGSISEVFDGDPPFRPGGCIAQAWGVAEVLRVLRAIEVEGAGG